MEDKIGFIGLGIMGKPMARNLINAGYKLFMFDINQTVLDEFKKEGIPVCLSPEELAQKTDIIITILPDSPQVTEVALGEKGLLYGLSEGKLYIDMSTIDVATVIDINARFAELGVEMLDAPVSGGQIGAEAATLSIMAGGSETAFLKGLPIFEVLGKRVIHMGKIGSGQITKSCSQIATALATQGVIEAFTLASKAGVDLSKVREALLGGFAESKALFITGDKIIREDFSPGFKLKLYRKDLRIAQNAGLERSVSLPGTHLLSQEMDELIGEGKGDLDFSVLINVFRK